MSRQLPPGWAMVPLGNVGRWTGGGTPSKAEQGFWNNGTVPWVSPKDMKIPVLHRAEDYITEAAVRGSATRIVEPGSVLVVTRSGILQRTLPVAINAVPVTLNQDLKAITPIDGIDARFLYWLLIWQGSDILRTCAKAGTTVASVETSRLQGLEVPIAPLSEQRRIVAVLEEYLSDLDAAVAGLERARANTQRYLRSLIEKRVTDLVSNGPLEPLRHVVRLLDQGWSPQCDRSVASADEWGVIKTTAVQPLRFLPAANKRLPARLAPRPALSLRAGDLLVTRAGPRSRVGISCVVTEDQSRLMNCDKVYRVQLHAQLARPEYIAIVLNSPSYLRRLDDLKSGISDSGVNLTQDRFLDLVVPLPPIGLQDDMLTDVALRKAMVEHAVNDIDVQLARSARLRQAILHRAFTGKLVSQDGKDQPASAPLGRIRGEDAIRPAPAPRPRGRPRATSSR